MTSSGNGMVSGDGKAGRGSLVAGGIAAVLASTCCLVAPVLAALGFGGAWAGHLTVLEPYRPLFIGAAVVALFFAYCSIFRPGQACKMHEDSRAPQVRVGHKIIFWIVAALVGIGLALEGIEKPEAGVEKKEAAVTSSGATTSAGKRKPMPDLAFVDLNGKPWKLSDHRGQVVLVNFWASWCPPCRKEMPRLVRLSNDYRSKGLEVVGVAMDEGGLEGVRRFVRKYDVPYPILLPGAGAAPLSASVATLPTTLLIDKQGQLAAMYSGAMEEAVFQRDVQRLLAER